MSKGCCFWPVKLCKKEKFKKIGFKSFGGGKFEKRSDFEGFRLLEVRK
jgi:hypothetical protein